MEKLLHSQGYSQKPHNIERHNHRTYELIYITKGVISVTIGSVCLKAQAPAVILINCLEEHSINILSSEYHRYFFTFSQKPLDFMLKDSRLFSLFKNHPDGSGYLFPVNQEIEAILSQLIQESSTQDDFSEAGLFCCLKLLLIHLYRQMPAPKLSLSPKALTQVYQIQQEIDRRFTEPILISELAKQYFVDKYYLTHCFKQLTGYTPKQYLLLNRISYAKELLQNSNQDMGAIAVQSGFSDANSFIRTFKKSMGITPLQYQKQNRN
ncbi:MAG: helix-turn-helix domain-containing protein [Massiliimalia sp.]|jgi:AraC-like DNA-binding protein